ncbi:MAG: TRAP transporter large permease subunit [Gudongella sp.]|jgi:tripartite ATP-independent transporter DctM subunit|nr:TRAP transporter large permease subunit [Gudongella sp.]
MISIAPLAVVIIMFGGLVLLSMTGFPIAFLLTGIGIILTLLTYGIQGTIIFVGRVFDQSSSTVLVAIPLFVIMANFLDRSGIAEDLFNAILHMLGKAKGGLAITIIILSVIFAASTGIIGAAVVGISLISMPILMQRGYDKSLSTGLICAGGSLGILIPPSIMLVMMADQSGQSVGGLFAGAFFPGLLLSALYLGYVIYVAHRYPEKAPALTEEELGKVTKAEKTKMFLKSFLPPMILILGVLGSIWGGIATPTEAAGLGCFIAFLMMVVYGRFNFKVLTNILIRSVQTTSMVMGTMFGATIFTAAFLRLKGGDVVTQFILSFSDYGRFAVFFVMMFIIFIMGFFIDWIGIIYITFPIFLPVASMLGFDPLWFVIMIAVNLQMSFSTPPFGYALFYMNATKPEGVTLKHIYKGVIPFIGLQLLGLILITFVPSIVTWLPSVLH